MPQEPPFNAATYPGISPETSFDWNTEEGRGLQMKFGRAFDALSQVRKAADVEATSTGGIHEATAVIMARGLDLLVNLPPFPLPGELASLNLPDLPIAMAVAVAHDQWCHTELDLTDFGMPGVSVVPSVVMRRVS